MGLKLMIITMLTISVLAAHKVTQRPNSAKVPGASAGISLTLDGNSARIGNTGEHLVDVRYELTLQDASGTVSKIEKDQWLDRQDSYTDRGDGRTVAGARILDVEVWQ